MDNLNKELQAERDKQVNESDLSPILKVYKKSLDEIRVEIAIIFTKYAVDGILTISKSQRYSILKRLESVLKRQGEAIGLIDVGHTTKLLREVYTDNYYKTAYMLDKGLEIGINFALLRPEMLIAAINTPLSGETFSSRIWKNKSLLVNRVRDAMEKGMTQGIQIDKLSRAIKKEFDVSAYESTRLIRTEMARVQIESSASIYAQSNVIKRVMYDATLDSKTSKQCAALDGQVFDANSTYPKPPQHPNCRCALLLIIPKWSPSKKRENIRNADGISPIIEYKNYAEWAAAKGI